MENISDPIRQNYLDTCTPEQHIQLLELEIKMNEDKMDWYSKNRLYKDELQHAASMARYKKHIDSKRELIKKLEKKLGK